MVLHVMLTISGVINARTRFVKVMLVTNQCDYNAHFVQHIERIRFVYINIKYTFDINILKPTLWPTLKKLWTAQH
jgi:hypothetical protein